MFTLGLSYNIPLERFEKELKDFRIIKPEKIGERFSVEEVKAFISECDAFVTMLDFPFKKELFDLAGKIKVIGNLGSGFDNVDTNIATEKGVLVLNTPKSVIAPTSEMTMTLILAITRSVCWYDKTYRADLTCHKELLNMRDMCLDGKKLGVLGFGRIGKAVAKKALAFGMQIIYYDLYRATPEIETEYCATYCETPEEVFKEADVVTIHMSYTPSVHHFINKERLSLMKPSSYLINASRGPIVSEADLYDCLKNHGIRGAALDVHESEPYGPKDISTLDNVVITPHICSNIAEVRLNMFEELATGLSGYLKEGKRPVNLANPAVWEKRS